MADSVIVNTCAQRSSPLTILAVCPKLACASAISAPMCSQRASASARLLFKLSRSRVSADTSAYKGGREGRAWRAEGVAALICIVAANTTQRLCSHICMHMILACKLYEGQKADIAPALMGGKSPVLNTCVNHTPTFTRKQPRTPRHVSYHTS